MSNYRRQTDWKPCAENDECLGAPIGAHDRCLAHLSSIFTGHSLIVEFRRLVRAETVDLRGVRFDADLLTRVLDACPLRQGSPTFLGIVRLDRAVFEGTANFEGVSFEQKAVFDGVGFQGWAEFGGTRFEKLASFQAATFKGVARFTKAAFEELADFGHATFKQDVRFRKAVFGGHGKIL